MIIYKANRLYKVYLTCLKQKTQPVRFTKPAMIKFFVKRQCKSITIKLFTIKLLPLPGFFYKTLYT